MTTSDTSNLLTTIENYLSSTGAAPSSFGRAAVNNPGLVLGMRRGKNIRHATAHRVLDYMKGQLEGLTAASARQVAEAELLADLAAVVEEAGCLGVDVVNRTILVPVPLEVVPASGPRLVGAEA